MRPQVDSPAVALVVRRYLRDHWQDGLLPVLEEAFDAIAKSDRVIHIAKLDLRITLRSEKELVEKLPTLIQQELRERFRAAAESSEGLPDAAIPWREFTPLRSSFESLLYYLRRGLLPWHLANAPQAIDLMRIAREQRRELADYVRRHGEAAGFYFRLLDILSEEDSVAVAGALFERFLPSCQTALVRVLTALLGDGGRFFNRHAQLTLAAAFIRAGMEELTSPETPDLQTVAQRVLPQSEHRAVGRFFSFLPQAAAELFHVAQKNYENTNVFSNAVATQSGAATMSDLETGKSPMRHFHNRSAESARQEHELENQFMWRACCADLMVLHPFSGAAATSDLETGKSPMRHFHNRSAESARQEHELENRFAWRACCAGLILLHPFIATLFEHIAIVEHENGRFSPEALSRAAALLFFVATGREDVHEWDLVWIKVMLGLAPQDPVLVSDGLLVSADKEEAEALLNAVIGHWGALKNTSIHGLRSSFLERGGLLREAENGWRLSVEPRPFDVLLDYCPWSISVVRMSWMKEPIYTDWRAL